MKPLRLALRRNRLMLMPILLPCLG